MSEGRDLVREVTRLGWNVSVHQAGPLLEQMATYGHVTLSRSNEGTFSVVWMVGLAVGGKGTSVFEAAMDCIINSGLTKPKE